MSRNLRENDVFGQKVIKYRKEGWLCGIKREQRCMNM